jgi:hypothetical protein
MKGRNPSLLSLPALPPVIPRAGGESSSVVIPDRDPESSSDVIPAPGLVGGNKFQPVKDAGLSANPSLLSFPAQAGNPGNKLIEAFPDMHQRPTCNGQ